MSRYSSNSSYGHRIEVCPWGGYRLHWTVDRYYAGSRLRFPTGYSRDVEHDGAVRFAKRHGLTLPEPLAAKP